MVAISRALLKETREQRLPALEPRGIHRIWWAEPWKRVLNGELQSKGDPPSKPLRKCPRRPRLHLERRIETWLFFCRLVSIKVASLGVVELLIKGISVFKTSRFSWLLMWGRKIIFQNRRSARKPQTWYTSGEWNSFRRKCWLRLWRNKSSIHRQK